MATACSLLDLSCNYLEELEYVKKIGLYDISPGYILFDEMIWFDTNFTVLQFIVFFHC